MALTVQALQAGLLRWADGLDRAAPELNRLDAQLGDGDLGATPVKCAASVRAALAGAPPADLGQVFKGCAMGCARASGSSFGTLLTVAFMTLARELEGRAEAAWTELPALMRACLDAMSRRGGAVLGDKTMLDALDAAARAVDGLDQPAAQQAAALAAVDRAIAEFRGRPNKIGRARMFAERSVGLDDPGMVALRHMAASLAG